MENIKLNEQIVFLRRQKGLTQEELARALGVTNQAVSKCESAQCCPDIALLPDIAKLFDVSIDELMGYKSADTFENVYLKIKSLFTESPAELVFENAFRLSVLLHEAACTKGYKGYAPWDTNKNYGMEDVRINGAFLHVQNLKETPFIVAMVYLLRTESPIRHLIYHKYGTCIYLWSIWRVRMS